MELQKNLCCCQHIIESAMTLVDLDAEVLNQSIQIVAIQLRELFPSEFYRAHVGRHAARIEAEELHFPFQEGHIEIGIVGDEGIGADKIEKLRDYDVARRSIDEHFLSNTIDTSGLRGNGPARIDERLKLIDDFAVAHSYRRYLDDPVAHFRAQARCFGIKNDVGQG